MNILITSAGRRTYLVEYFKTALKGLGKVYASNSTFSPALTVADDFILTPLIFDKDYIPFLLKYVTEKKISMIISLFDIDLPILAKSKNIFKAKGVDVIVSDFQVIEICNDKWESYKFFVENGFNTPKTYIHYNTALQDLKDEILVFPIILKPRWGMGSIGIYKVESQIEFEVLYKKVQQEIESTYLINESKTQLDQAIIIQECISGQEYGLDIFNDLEGEYLETFVKKKIAMRSGETESAITEDNETLRELGMKLSRKLKHIGNLDSDWFLSEDKIYILEMNCRFGGGYPFTHLAGANLPKVLIDLIKYKKYDIEDLNIEYGVEMMKDIKPIRSKNI